VVKGLIEKQKFFKNFSGSTQAIGLVHGAAPADFLISGGIIDTIKQ